MSSKPDSSDKLEKRLPAGGQAVTGVGSGGRGSLGSSREVGGKANLGAGERRLAGPWG